MLTGPPTRRDNRLLVPEDVNPPGAYEAPGSMSEQLLGLREMHWNLGKDGGSLAVSAEHGVVQSGARVEGVSAAPSR